MGLLTGLLLLFTSGPGLPAVALRDVPPPREGPAFVEGAPVAGAETCEAPRDLVVLLHGMGRTSRSMAPLARALDRAGYEVLNHGYPSRSSRVAVHGPKLVEILAREASREDIRRIHFVGHSLGNIVIRWALAHHGDRVDPGKIGRVVMLAPPNGGSRKADFFEPWMSWLSRPLTDLTTAPGSTAHTIPRIDGVEIGIIAGSRDSIVRVDETRLDEMTDHVVVPSGHTFIMRRDIVIELTRRFLATGSLGTPVETPETRAPAD